MPHTCSIVGFIAVTVAPAAVTVAVVPRVAMLGDSPAGMQCPHCRAQIVTRVDHEVGLLTWLIVGVLCIFM